MGNIKLSNIYCKDYPPKVPLFFTDLKIENYGWIGDQFVCVDYGSVYFSTMIPVRRGKMMLFKRAKWWTVERLRNRTKKNLAKKP